MNEVATDVIPELPDAYGDRDAFTESAEQIGTVILPGLLAIGDLERIADFRLRVLAALRVAVGPHPILTLNVLLRRTERTLALGIRRGQQPGPNKWIRALRDDTRNTGRLTSPYTVAKVRDRTRMHGMYQLADGVSDEQFDKALAACRDEWNASHNNVMRKLRGDDSKPHDNRRQQIASLADKGYNADQIGQYLGCAAAQVRTTANKYGIRLPAAHNGASGRWEPSAVLRRTDMSIRVLAESLDGLVRGTGELSPAALATAATLARSAKLIAASARKLNDIKAGGSSSGEVG